jgi:uncharacterized protein (DUF2147 family)
MRWLLIILAVLCCPLIGVSQNNGDKIIGRWLNEDGQAKFEIYKASPAYSAKIIWLANPLNNEGQPKVDKNNPDKNLRSRPIIGMEIFTGLKFYNGFWAGTEIYSPEKGMYANLKIELADGDHLTIIASKGIFSTTKNWTRI